MMSKNNQIDLRFKLQLLIYIDSVCMSEVFFAVNCTSTNVGVFCFLFITANYVFLAGWLTWQCTINAWTPLYGHTCIAVWCLVLIVNFSKKPITVCK